MEKRNIIFHGTRSEVIKNIIEEGLKPSRGVYGEGVYTTKSPYKSLEKSGGDSIIIINPRGLENYAFIPKKQNGREKDWIVFEKEIPPEKILGILEIKDGKVEYFGRDGKIVEPYKSENELKKIIGEITRKLNDAIYNPIRYEKIKRRIVP